VTSTPVKVTTLVGRLDVGVGVMEPGSASVETGTVSARAHLALLRELAYLKHRYLLLAGRVQHELSRQSREGRM